MALAMDGLGQVTQAAAVPHWVRLLLAKHRVPVPGQVCESAPHEVPQTPASLQVALSPPGHAVHETLSVVPQVSTSEFATQTPPQRWKPGLQVNPQVPPVQVLTAFGWTGHGVQLAPHEFTLPFAEHVVGLAVGQPWNPVAQASPQVGGVPAQVGPPFAGSGQTVQELPQEFTLVLLLATQVLPQRWKPALQLGTHIPLALHNTEPFVGDGQAVQPFMLHPEATVLLATHVLPHR